MQTVVSTSWFHSLLVCDVDSVTLFDIFFLPNEGFYDP